LQQTGVVQIGDAFCRNTVFEKTCGQPRRAGAGLGGLADAFDVGLEVGIVVVRSSWWGLPARRRSVSHETFSAQLLLRKNPVHCTLAGNGQEDGLGPRQFDAECPHELAIQQQTAGLMHAQDSAAEPGFNLVRRGAVHAKVPEADHPANKGTSVWVGLDRAVDGSHGDFLPRSS
jgi:hypothetical protein